MLNLGLIDMTLRSDDSLSDDAWVGLPLQLGQFPAQGKVEGVVSPHDAVLVWSGGKSDTTIHIRSGQEVERHGFVRRGGMVDFVPKGLLFEEIRWKGQTSECIAVGFEPNAIERIIGKTIDVDPQGVRLALMEPHIVDLVRRLQEQDVAGHPWGSMYTEALSLTLVSYVYGRYATGTELRQGAPPMPAHQVQRLVAFVEDHLAENITLTRLARLVGCSTAHFGRIFKQTFGRTPYNYVLERRVERAKLLLRDHQYSIAEVAVVSGFGSQAHLHTAFKARTGVTPGSYRKG